ncbi:MAG: type II toxin-antitoxin system RelE/ParE family toxin [Hyphomicrobiaceae bacterium]
MRIFKTKWFARFARREGVEDVALVAAIRQIEAGRVDADLGGGIVKQRVARRGQGKSGGYRTIIAYRSGDRAVFLHGFAKSDVDNIDADDLERLKGAARQMMTWDQRQISKQLVSGAWLEIEDDA